MNFKKASGFSLLEVLIAFIIIMVSVVSLVSLYRFYIRSESNSAMLNGAMLLAESKLDDLRMFDSVATSDGVASYNDIDDNLGGDITAGDKTLSGYKYTLGWTVIDSDLTGFTIPVTTTIYPAKNVTVNVSWSDSSGETKSLSLTGVISKIVSADSEQIANTSKSSSIKPKILYQAGDAPEVIAIDLGNGSKQETTKPIPDVSNTGGGIAVQFSTITYNNLEGSDYNQALSDMLSLSCSCSISSGERESYLPAKPTSINNLLYWTMLSPAFVEKKWGKMTNDKQSSLCSTCCLNHFDKENDFPNEDGYKTLSEFDKYYNKIEYPSKKYTESDMNAYLSNNTSTPSPVSSGSYVDSCRLMLLDGVYKPLPDWNLIKLAVMSSDFLSNKTNQVIYQNYVEYVIGEYVKLQNSGNWPSKNSSLKANALSGIKSLSQWMVGEGYTEKTDVELSLSS